MKIYSFNSLMYIADYIPAVPSIAVSVTAKVGHSTEDLVTVTQISTPPIVPSDTW